MLFIVETEAIPQSQIAWWAGFPREIRVYANPGNMATAKKDQRLALSPESSTQCARPEPGEIEAQDEKEDVRIPYVCGGNEGSSWTIKSN